MPYPLMIGALHTFGQRWWRLRANWVKSIDLNSVRIMTFSANPPSLLAARSPITYSLSM